jgi:hypothetical protein
MFVTPLLQNKKAAKKYRNDILPGFCPWLLKSIKIHSSRWNQETPLAARILTEFHQEGNPLVIHLL